MTDHTGALHDVRNLLEAIYTHLGHPRMEGREQEEMDDAMSMADTALTRLNALIAALPEGLEKACNVIEAVTFQTNEQYLAGQTLQDAAAIIHSAVQKEKM